MRVDLFLLEENGPESKSKKVVERLPSCKNTRHEHARFALMGIDGQGGRNLVHKDEGHQHPEHICTKILHRMRVVSEKIRS